MRVKQTYPAWKQALASAFAAVAVGIGLWVRILGGGWILIPLFLPYLSFLFFSTWVLLLSIRMKKLAVGLTITAGIASFLAFAFQVDYGDDGTAWFAITAVFESDATQRPAVPAWWITNGTYALVELILFIPAVILLISILIQRPFREEDRDHSHVTNLQSSSLDPHL